MSKTISAPIQTAKANVGTSAVVFTATDIRAKAFNFVAPKGNAADIFVGGAALTTASYMFRLQPGEEVEIEALPGERLNLANFYVIGENTTDDVAAGYIR